MPCDLVLDGSAAALETPLEVAKRYSENHDGRLALHVTRDGPHRGAIRIPGSLVLIGAMVGATLLGLLGALVACPISASILLIIKKVVVPAQNAR